MSEDAIYQRFFADGEVRQDFSKEYISLWPEWLGGQRLHLLDKVSEDEWLKFNRMLLAIFGTFQMGVVNRVAELLISLTGLSHF